MDGIERTARAGAAVKPFALKAACPREDDEQAALAKLLDMLAGKYGFRWAHVPNGGARDVRVAARLKSHGVKRGVPDVLIFGAPPALPGAAGVAIELKKRVGGVVSRDQEGWLEYLESNNWKVAVCKGWEEAWRMLRELGWR